MRSNKPQLYIAKQHALNPKAREAAGTRRSQEKATGVQSLYDMHASLVTSVAVPVVRGAQKDRKMSDNLEFSKTQKAPFKKASSDVSTRGLHLPLAFFLTRKCK